MLHPLVAVALLTAIVLILFTRRKYIVIPLLLAVMFIPKPQVLVFAGAHFTAAEFYFSLACFDG